MFIWDLSIIDQDFYNGLLANRPSDDELRDLYQKNLPDYDQPEQRYLKYVKWPILSNANDSLRVKLEAEDLIFRLNDGEDFALLANTYTEDPSNSADPQNLKGGDPRPQRSTKSSISSKTYRINGKEVSKEEYDKIMEKANRQ